MKRNLSNAYLFIIIPILTCLTCGCGDGLPPRTPISGKVLIDGQPVTCGTICVIPENARPAAGEIGSDGTFTLSSFFNGDGAVLGTHRVTVTSYEDIDYKSRRWLIPKEYSDIDTTDVTVTIDGPNDNLVINITWNGGKPFIENLLPH